MTRRQTLITVIGVYVFALHLTVIYWFVDQRQTQAGQQATFRQTLHQYYLRRDHAVPAGSIVFLGDSHVHALCVSCINENAVNLGIPGLTSMELAANIDAYQSLTHAKSIIIQTGHNDLKTASQTDTVAAVTSILQALPSGADLVLMAPFPVDESKRPDLIGYNQKKVTQLAQFEQLCQNPCRLLNLWPEALAGEAGPNMLASDGVHLNRQGYDQWVEQLKEHIHGS